MKKLAFIALTLVVLLLAAVVLVSVYIDSIARSAIERGSTYALGVDTTLSSADVQLTSGRFTMGGLMITNPGGFNTDHFLKLNDAGVEVTLGSLRSETVNLPVLRFEGLDVNIERRNGSTNVQSILNNLKRFESTDETTKEDKGGGKKFIIEEVDIQNVSIHVDAALPLGGESTRVDLPIDRIQLKNVGSDSDGGVLLSELSSIIVKAIMAAAIEQGGDLIPAELLSDLQGQLAQLEDLSNSGVELLAGVQGQLEDITAEADALTGRLSGSVEDIGKQAEEIGKQAEDAIDEVGRNIDNLFGGDKDKKDKDQ